MYPTRLLPHTLRMSLTKVETQDTLPDAAFPSLTEEDRLIAYRTEAASRPHMGHGSHGMQDLSRDLVKVHAASTSSSKQAFISFATESVEPDQHWAPDFVEIQKWMHRAYTAQKV